MVAREPQATVFTVFFNVAHYAIPVARDAIPVARYVISVSREGGNLHLGGTVVTISAISSHILFGMCITSIQVTC